VLVVVGALQRYRAQPSMAYRDWPLLLYGWGMLLAGIFSTTPFMAGVAYSQAEANLHSLLATLAGVGISLAVFLSWLRDPEPRTRPWHLVALVLIVLLSAAVGMATREAGLIQRCLWVVGFSWLVYIDPPPVKDT
jgi:hypothetical protein